MNLQRPHDRVDEQGAVLNHWLRAARGRQPSATTAELFVAFGTLSAEALQKRLRERDSEHATRPCQYASTENKDNAYT
jgi:hypothetical protein